MTATPTPAERHAARMALAAHFEEGSCKVCGCWIKFLVSAPVDVCARHDERYDWIEQLNEREERNR